MSSSAQKSSKSIFTTQSIVLAGITWGILSLLFFLLFSANPPNWYSPLTYIFGFVSNLAAAFLCFRNWKSPQIVSGRSVWLGIGLGMFFYFLGDILFGIWELVFNQNPAVSPGDLFYIISYICLSVGLFLAVTTRRLNLELKQWLIVAGIFLTSTLLAVWLSLPAGVDVEATSAQPVATQTQVAAAEAPAETPATQSAPEIVIKLEETLQPLESVVTLLYTILDVLLLIAASTVLLAFWGGRTSQSWRMIAAAAFSLYIADMWFKYAIARVPDYESGGLLEIFWIFSPILFGIGAALEFDLSTRSTRRSRRRGSN
ncbi:MULTISPECIES: hypothetical protein [unclassified Roseofilum]|uniref:hypothetical protein n=1 Tax=unclassified Roseofilum TaxID=2620099 RepID=UPI000E9B5499|nr:MULTISPECIES: hypothetical protein [unclassified Roseofilum]HBQ97286.1 hypothetical protein [Cyanobacteria bacterium UBA11691]MBP0009775.1 hypothetical protein [Roseofilum sp. Belize Diploria]MBP0013362.1 hypothetical protein [Roseofilum sp. SID3]MBP0024029.1 hypothetical protein [Roseofilum sp. SID2]MBP0034194.1 hypothetical protein [Roseofilum sp. Belize BBD 4]